MVVCLSLPPRLSLPTHLRPLINHNDGDIVVRLGSRPAMDGMGKTSETWVAGSRPCKLPIKAADHGKQDKNKITKWPGSGPGVYILDVA